MLTYRYRIMNEKARVGNLIVIDDDDIDHFLYQRIINRSNLVDESVFFTSAEDALEYLKRSDRIDIHAILLDVNMPRMNGFEFLEAATKEIGVEHLGAVVVMLTTSLNPRDEARAKSYSVVKGYLEKPLSTEHLIELTKIVN